MNEHYRQGDVLIERIASIPDDVQPVPLEDGRIVLAHGEVTGHAHAIKSRTCRLTVKGLERFLTVGKCGAVLRHEEHDAVTLPPGAYRVEVQREYSPEAIRNVAD